MTVLSVAYPLLPVDSGSAGGAEQILYLLEQGMAARGVQSLVIAAPGSQVRGELWEGSALPEEIDDDARGMAQHVHRQLIRRVLQAHEVDLIHYHGLDFAAYCIQEPEQPVPQVATIHLPPEWYSPESFFSGAVVRVCVSRTQAAALQKPAQVIENGINLRAYGSKRESGNRLLWLGRICAEKGTHLALEVARDVGMGVDIAGPVHPFGAHRAYFDQQVKPLLNEERRYLGAVDLRAKQRLLASAKALLIPSLAPETSSLVAMEAAAAGVPVIAFRSGALPEVVTHGVTGFLVNSADEMADAVGRVNQIQSNTCREHAAVRFSSERMVDEYVALYRETVSAAR